MKAPSVPGAFEARAEGGGAVSARTLSGRRGAAFAFAPCGAVQPAFPLGKPGRADGPVFQGVTDDGRRGPGSLFSAGGSLPLSVSKTVFSLKQRTPEFPCGSCFVMGEKFIFSSSDGTGRILWCARFLLGEWGARALGGFPVPGCRQLGERRWHQAGQGRVLGHVRRLPPAAPPGRPRPLGRPWPQKPSYRFKRPSWPTHPRSG